MLLKIILIALGLSADSFAVAVCLGLKIKNSSGKEAFFVGLYFGVFQAVMLLLGFYTASVFRSNLQTIGQWLAVAVLVILGLKTALGAFKKEKGGSEKEFSLSPLKMIPLSLATSTDALAVGASLVFLNISIAPATVLIGTVAFVFSAIGVKLGNLSTKKIKRVAELLGGIILIIMGILIPLNF
ncbi:MAG: manganese efflux pump MntP family protein [Firmicutes bacterium]|nr:manganese efflux pump MntP family protein [Bacillota bacterium]